MVHGKVSSLVTHSVRIDGGRYGSPLVVTSHGTIAPAHFGAAGVRGDVTGDRLVNHGVVVGGAGRGEAQGDAKAGGAGADFRAYGFVDNQGMIAGGNGGSCSSQYGNGGAGGDGILLEAGGKVLNDGTITGGYGGVSTDRGPGGLGGAGVDLAAYGNVTNHGTILGGASGYSTYDNYAPGSAGILLRAGGVVENTGTIIGGMGAFGFEYYTASGAGVDARAVCVVRNSGTICGGGTAPNPWDGASGQGGQGVLLEAGGMLANTGSVLGGNAGYQWYGSESGGAGVYLGAAGTVLNRGGISGGAGSSGHEGGGDGGTGLTLTAGCSAVNAGTISGGIGGRSHADYGGGAGNGGLGVRVIGAATLTNHGSISGGVAGTDFYQNGGHGGLALYAAGGHITNAGLIAGGAGLPDNYSGGGAGVNLSAGAVLVNSGTITGGAGAAATAWSYQGGNGGDGVDLSNATLVTSGTIAGGAAGIGAHGSGTIGAAVSFGQQAATLVVDPGAVFVGDIVANAAVQDTLRLAGGGAGTLTGFGDTITGFSKIVDDVQAKWLLVGTIAGGAISMGAGAVLALQGSASGGGLTFAGGGGETLRLVAAMAGSFADVMTGFSTGDTIALGGLAASSLTYGGGTLTLFDSAGNAVDALFFSGNYVAADFSLVAAHGGTDIVYAGQGGHAHTALLEEPVGHEAWLASLRMT